MTWLLVLNFACAAECGSPTKFTIRKSGSLHSGGQRLDETRGKSNERPARLRLLSGKRSARIDAS